MIRSSDLKSFMAAHAVKHSQHHSLFHWWHASGVPNCTLVPEFARFAIGNLGIGNMGSRPRLMVKAFGIP
jgi:hypothetical protein